MKYVFDLDGTLCTDTNGNYHEAIPFINRINKVNELFEAGQTIIIATARGMGSSGNNGEFAETRWSALTRLQLEAWGVKYHDLFLGKPSGDFYIDDKAVKDSEFFEESKKVRD